MGNQFIDELRIAAAGEWGAERGGAGGCHYASDGDGEQARAAGCGAMQAPGGGEHRYAGWEHRSPRVCRLSYICRRQYACGWTLQ